MYKQRVGYGDMVELYKQHKEYCESIGKQPVKSQHTLSWRIYRGRTIEKIIKTPRKGVVGNKKFYDNFQGKKVGIAQYYEGMKQGLTKEQAIINFKKK